MSEGHYEVTCEFCGKVTCYLDEREDGLIECMHCGQEIETDMEAQDYDEHV